MLYFFSLFLEFFRSQKYRSNIKHRIQNYTIPVARKKGVMLAASVLIFYFQIMIKLGFCQKTSNL